MSAQAAVVGGSITGFVPNPLPATGGAYTRVGSWQWALGKSVAQYEAEFAGRALVGEATMTAASTAGRTLAGACLASGPALAVCGTAAAAAWFAASRIHWDDIEDKYMTDEDQYGACYHAKYPGDTQNYMPCSMSAASAMSSWVNTANAINFLDSGNPNGSHIDFSFATNVVPGFIAEGSQANGSATRTKKTVTCDAQGNNCNTVVTTDSYAVPIKRDSDQMTTFSRPSTPGDMNNHGDKDTGNGPGIPPDDVMNNWGGPVPTNNPDLKPDVVTTGDKYSPDDTPNEGPWRQDRIKFGPRTSTADPMDLDVTTESTDVDNPNTPDIIEGPPDGSDPGSTGTSEEPFDLCKEHPHISACQELGDPPDDDVPTDQQHIDFQPVSVGLPSGCPAPIAVIDGQFLSFDTACDAAERMSPLVIAAGGIAGLLIAVAAIRR